MFLAQCTLLIKWSGWDVNGMDLIAANWSSLTHHSHQLNFKKADGCFISGNRIMCQLSFLFHSWARVKLKSPHWLCPRKPAATISPSLKGPRYILHCISKAAQPWHLNHFTATIQHSMHLAKHGQQPHGLAELFKLREPACKPEPNLHT